MKGLKLRSSPKGNHKPLLLQPPESQKENLEKAEEEVGEQTEVPIETEETQARIDTASSESSGEDETDHQKIE